MIVLNVNVFVYVSVGGWFLLFVIVIVIVICDAGTHVLDRDSICHLCLSK